MSTPAARLVAALTFSVGLAATALPAAAQNAALIALVGTDTFSFERYSRQGNVITGSWVVMHAPGVYVHDYRITLSPDGLPVHYTMKYSEPLSEAAPGLDSVIVDYSRDTVAYTFTTRDSSFGRKVALHEAFPFLGQSLVGLDLALRRLRAAHADSGVIVGNETSNLVTPPRRFPVRLAGDSAMIGAATRVHMTPEGGLIDLTDGRRTVRQDASLDVARLTQHFVDVYRPRVAAMKAAAEARREIALPASQLDRFVGGYGKGAIVVKRDGEHLVATFTNGLPVTLLAMSQTEFFVRKPDLVVTFDLDGNGAAQAMTIVQGDVKQRLPRDSR